jgi:hypothetical protein
MRVGEGGWGRDGGEWNHAVSRSGRLGPSLTRRPDDGLRKERPSATETKGKTVSDLKWSERTAAPHAQQPDNPVPIVRFRASWLMLGKVRAATAPHSVTYVPDSMCFVCVHVGHLRCFFLLKEKTTQWHSRVAAEGTFSRPLDKSLGREADPEGGKIYDKGSACPRSRGGWGKRTPKQENRRQREKQREEAPWESTGLLHPFSRTLRCGLCRQPRFP